MSIAVLNMAVTRLFSLARTKLKALEPRSTADTCCAEPSILRWLLHIPRNSQHSDILQSPCSFSYEDENANLFIDNGVWDEPQSSVTDARTKSKDIAPPATPPSPKVHQFGNQARTVKEEVGWVDDDPEKWNDRLLVVDVIDPLPPRAATNALGIPLPSPDLQQSASLLPTPFSHLSECPLSDNPLSVGLGTYNRSSLNMPGFTS